MKRLARVVARSGHAITLELIKARKCAACPANCNQPLVDLFGLRKNLLTLDNNSEHYDLSQNPIQWNDQRQLGQVIQLQISQGDLLKSSGFLYLIPLMIILLTVTVGHFTGHWLNLDTDLSAMLGLIVGLFLAYRLARSKIWIKPLNFRPKVTIL